MGEARKQSMKPTTTHKPALLSMPAIETEDAYEIFKTVWKKKKTREGERKETKNQALKRQQIEDVERKILNLFKEKNIKPDQCLSFKQIDAERAKWTMAEKFCYAEAMDSLFRKGYISIGMIMTPEGEKFISR